MKKAAGTSRQTGKRTSALMGGTASGESSTAKKPKRATGSKELSAFFRTYKSGFEDIHWPIFRAVNEIVRPKSVLYPGCHRHVTASLVFPDVLYLDSDNKVGGCFTDPKVREWVEEHKEYMGETKIRFKCKNFEANFGEQNNSFDLLISLSAGIVSRPCNKYLKQNGYFLAGDAHFDARMVYLDTNFRLIGVWNDSAKNFETSLDELADHFTTTSGEKITSVQVQESIDKPKAKRSFKLQKESHFYLFQKIK